MDCNNKRWMLNLMGITAFGVLALGAGGCSTMATNQEVMRQLDNLDRKVTSNTDQQIQFERKMVYSLENIDESLQANNEIARQTIDDLEKRMRDQIQEIERLRQEVETMRFSLGLGGRGSSSTGGMTGQSSTMQTPAGDPVAQALSSGLNQFSAGNYSAARELFGQALAGEPNTEQAAELNFWIGESYYSEENYPEAETHYTQAIKANPNHEKSWVSFERLAQIQLAQGQKIKALKQFEYIAETYPDYPNIDRVTGQIEVLRAELYPEEQSPMPSVPEAPAE